MSEINLDTAAVKNVMEKANLILHQLSSVEKVLVMEAIWQDLSMPDSSFVSPNWHRNELEATERRVANGEEVFLDWDSTKKQIQQK